MFPCLTVEQVRLLLRKTNGNIDDAAEMAFELLNDTPTTSNSSPMKQSVVGEYRGSATQNQFMIAPSLSSEPIRNGMISESCLDEENSIEGEQK